MNPLKPFLFGIITPDSGKLYWFLCVLFFILFSENICMCNPCLAENEQKKKALCTVVILKFAGDYPEDRIQLQLKKCLEIAVDREMQKIKDDIEVVAYAKTIRDLSLNGAGAEAKKCACERHSPILSIYGEIVIDDFFRVHVVIVDEHMNGWFKNNCSDLIEIYKKRFPIECEIKKITQSEIVEKTKDFINTYTRVCLALAFMYQRDFSKAFATISSLPDRERLYDLLIFEKAVVLEKGCPPDEAIEELEKLLKINPYFVDAYAKLGVYYRKKGLLKESQKNFDTYKSLISQQR